MNSEKLSKPPEQEHKKTDRENFIFSMQLELLQKALSTWPRRGQPLLEVNCGEGCFLPFIWQSGFDIIATETDAKMRQRIFELSIPGIEIYAASADHLPFEDDYCDWVILHIQNTDKEDVNNCSAEALRVARRGVMITFWNLTSLPAICASRKNPLFGKALRWHTVWKILDTLHSGRLRVFSTLCAPVLTWQSGWPVARLNKLLSWTPFGAWCIARLDLAPISPVTPLPLHMKQGLSKNQPLFEYAHKNCKPMMK